LDQQTQQDATPPEAEAADYRQASLPDEAGANKRARPLVALLGPTAVGKTAAALALAPRFNAEVISADSRQVYRGMDIGTAKATPAERAAVPHHLIDIRDPDEPFGLADFLALAGSAIDDIHARGHLPLLVGGTAQYAYALLEGWRAPNVPPQPALRARLEAEGAAALHSRLVTVDPAAAARIGPRNLRRLVRALEVYEVTGRPISAQQTRRPPSFRALRLGLTLPRDALYARVDARVDAQLAGGLIDEVRALLAAGYPPDLPAFNSMGYIEVIGHLRGDLTLAEARAQIAFNTHRYVRHQETWLRRDPAIAWIDAADPAAAHARLAELMAGLLAEAEA
jgi:tRNA dimethylallyltransferase